VAHEINNPIGLIKSNLGSLKEQVESLLLALSAYEEVEKALTGQPAPPREMHIDYWYLTTPNVSSRLAKRRVSAVAIISEVIGEHTAS